MHEASFGARVGLIARADTAAAFTASRLKGGEMAITKLLLAHPMGDITEPLGGDDDAVVVSVALQSGYARDAWIDGRALPDSGPMAEGTVTFMDMREANQARFRTPVRMVQFYFSRRALNLCADEQGSARLGELQVKPLSPLQDVIFHQLALIVRPAFVRPSEVTPLFADSLMMAASTHLLEAYAGVRGDKSHRGGLAPKHLRRALELLEADLDGDLSLSGIAAQCGLSPRHFSRAFTQSMGVPPHRWLLQHRIERAKDLLRDPALSLDDVAVAARFTTRSHFNRVFSTLVGQTPWAWRRAQS